MLPDPIALGDFPSDDAAPAGASVDPREAAAGEREELLERIRADAAAVFDEIFAMYQSMVFQLACRVLGDREEALDLSQEVFLTVYRKLPRFRGESSLKTWIYRITVNRAANRCRWWNCLRRRGTVSLDGYLGAEPGFSLADLLPSAGDSPEAALLAREQQAEIERSLLHLPVHQRVAVVMRDIEGLSYEEIAETTQVSLGTVKSRIARGREELKRRLNGALAPAPGAPESP
jgi:RNA polymerase sigma-70 factor (ECF subfamily)